MRSAHELILMFPFHPTLFCEDNGGAPVIILEGEVVGRVWDRLWLWAGEVTLPSALVQKSSHPNFSTRVTYPLINLHRLSGRLI